MKQKNPFKLEQVSIRLVTDEKVPVAERIRNPEAAIQYVAKEIRSSDREMLCVINLKSDGTPINFTIASIGVINSALASPRELLKSSILSNAANMILLHNHPSGSLTPSKEDINLTNQMIKICGYIDIPLLDHIIISPADENKYYSFKEKGEMYFDRKRVCSVEELSFSIEQAKKSDVIRDFKNITNQMFKPINNLSAEQIEDIVVRYIEASLSEQYPEVELVDIALTGSRSRGFEKTDSDIDIVFEYKGDIKEYELFNYLNENGFSLGKYKIDINPIRKEETGTLEQYLSNAEEYYKGSQLFEQKKAEDLVMKRFKNVAVDYGYPIIAGGESVIFPEEYDDIFSQDELETLRNAIKKNLENEKNKEKVLHTPKI